MKERKAEEHGQAYERVRSSFEVTEATEAPHETERRRKMQTHGDDAQGRSTKNKTTAERAESTRTATRARPGNQRYGQSKQTE